MSSKPNGRSDEVVVDLTEPAAPDPDGPDPEFLSKEQHFVTEFIVRVPSFGIPGRHDPLETLRQIVRLSLGEDVAVERRRKRKATT